MNQNQEVKDVYSIVNDRIIELLQAGTVPWQKPWTDAGLPKNIISKRPYRGINLLLLNSMDYEDNLFLTWKQLKTINGSVKKGEKGHVVVFTKMVEKQKENGQIEKKSFLRYYKVFNIHQCTDIPTAFLPAKREQQHEPLEECEAVVAKMSDPPKIEHKKRQAYYVPSEDLINMPKPSTFKNMVEYHGTLFHELIHSTGHQKRLNRKEIAENPAFGSEMYSLEELVAEMGSCYLKSYTGVPVEKMANSAAYINGWLEVLNGDARFVIKAASFSQKAVEYILRSGKESAEEHEKTLALEYGGS
jgi:antirestriction protein ArdC